MNEYTAPSTYVAYLTAATAVRAGRCGLPAAGQPVISLHLQTACTVSDTVPVEADMPYGLELSEGIVGLVTTETRREGQCGREGSLHGQRGAAGTAARCMHHVMGPTGF